MPRSTGASSLAASALAFAIALPLDVDAATLHRIGFLPGTSSPGSSFVRGSRNDVYFWGQATAPPSASFPIANVRWSLAGGLEEFAGLIAPQPAPEFFGGTAFFVATDAQGQVVAEFDSLGGATPVPWIPRTFDSSLVDATPDARVFLGWYGSNSSSSAMFRYTVGGALELVGDPGDEAVVQPIGLPNHGDFAVANELGVGVAGAAYRWLADGSTQTIGPPPAQPTDVFSAAGVSQDGSTILGWVHASFSPTGTAARWSAVTGTELLADPGGVFSSSVARYLAPDGRIYG